MPDSSAIDAALTALLVNDAPLSALMPDGVYVDEARQGAERFVIISLIEEADEGVFNGRAYEDALYLVKAVEKGSSGNHAKQAEARIATLLEDQALTAAGYTWMTVFREARIRYTEVDEADRSIRWQHRGGHYRVQMSVT